MSCSGNCVQGRACDCDDGASHLTTGEIALFATVLGLGAAMAGVSLYIIGAFVWGAL